MFIILNFKSCIECIKDLLEKISEMGDFFTENFQEMKDKFHNINMTNFDFIEEITDKLRDFKEEVIEKVI
jgi:hypothetical protein